MSMTHFFFAETLREMWSFSSSEGSIEEANLIKAKKDNVMGFLQLLGVLCFSRTHKSLMRFLLLASDLEVVFYSKVAFL